MIRSPVTHGSRIFGSGVSPVLLFSLLALGLSHAAPPPLVQFEFEEGSGYATANTGTIGSTAVLSHNFPVWATSPEVNGGASYLNFGSTSDTSYHVDFSNTAALANLKSFTIMGWLNCKSTSTAYGGNRIVTWYNNVTNGQGVDLSMHADGSLGMGVNSYNDQNGGGSGVNFSSTGKIPVDPNGGFSNWRFFAVTYNSTLSSNQINYYFGNNGSSAALDVTLNYNRGAIGTPVSSVLTVGNHNPTNRTNPTYSLNQGWKGGIDQIQIFGSTTDGSGALSQGDIISIQNATQNSGVGGLLYQQYTGIVGSTVGSLVTAPNYPNNPSSTTVYSSFDGPQNCGINNFGAKMSGWILAPQTGSYIFWLASDDNGELRLSTDANPANKQLIASVASYTGYQSWTSYPSQQSAPISLVAGQYYYIEALMKQDQGNTNLSVGWQLPGGTQERPIPAGRVFLNPPGGTSFPDSISLYESTTSKKGATIGWRSDSSYFFINTMGGPVPEVKIKNGTITTPDSLNVATLKATTMVTTPKWQIPDYVFEKGYTPESLQQVESFVKTNHHLPGMPSAEDIAAKGMDLSEMNVKLLKAVEELTLHVIELNKDVENETSKNTALENELESIRAKVGSEK